MKSNILVTGGCGFIGSSFIDLLIDSNKYNIINIDKLTYASNVEYSKLNKKNYKFLKGDIVDHNLIRNVLNKYKPKYIFNFAAESHVDNSIKNPKTFIDSNIIGTFNILFILHKLWKNQNNKKNRLIHISTDEVYGSLKPKDKSFTEKSNYMPNSPYSSSKAASELLVRSWVKTYNFNAIITNCSNNYGPWQNSEKLIPKVIFNALNKKRIPLYGNGKNIRDWIHVDDHITAILKIMKKGTVGEKYNIGGNCELTNLKIINLICDIIQKKLKTKYDYKSLITYVTDRPGHDFRYSVNDNKIRRNLNFKNEINFTKGINSTIDWYLANYEK